MLQRHVLRPSNITFINCLIESNRYETLSTYFRRRYCRDIYSAV